MKISLNTTHDFLCDFTENYNVFPTKPGFLKDQLASVWQFWRPERAIFLVSPTGSGKTTFIVETIVEEILKEPEQKLVLVSNRIALDVAIKRKISKKTGLYAHFNDVALHEMSTFKNVTIVSYQQLKNHMKFSEKSFSTVSHVVFDEVHYLTSDATFSPGNGALLERIPHVFKNAVRIYITATPAQVLTHISASECNSFANLRWQKQWETHHNSIISAHLHYTQIINNTKNVFEKTFWDSATPSPILYMMHPDFSWINLHFFQSAKEIETLLSTEKKKTLYFVSNKAQGQELHEKFPDSAYFDADTKAENPGFFEKLLKTERFEERILFCTSVYENGCNINDSDVKNVIVEPLHPISILQMAGRRRRKTAADSLNLFLKIPSISQLQRICFEIGETLKLIQNAENDYDSFLKNILKNKEQFEKIFSLVSTENGKICFDKLSKAALVENFHYFSYIKNLIETSGPIAYCELISTKLFGKDFLPEMVPENMQQSAHLSMSEWLEQRCYTEMNAEDFKNFSTEFLQKCKEHALISASENRGKKRQMSGSLLIQNRLKEFNLPFTIAKIGSLKYILLNDNSYKKIETTKETP